MDLTKRVKEVILKPHAAWQTIKGESTEIKDLIINVAAPLALIPAVANFIGMTVIGMRVPSGQMVRAPFLESVAGGAVGYVLQLLGLWVGIYIVKLLAPYFNSKSDLNAAAKLVVYSMIPVWLTGIFQVIPALGVLSILGLYAIYLLYIGLPVIMETPADKRLMYTAAIIVAGIVVSFALSIIVVGVIYGPMYMRMMSV